MSITLVKNNAKENWTDIKPKAALINKPEKKKAAAKGGDETATDKERAGGSTAWQVRWCMPDVWCTVRFPSY